MMEPDLPARGADSKRSILNSFKIQFFSSCPEDWGGSEELWGGAASILVARGHQIRACKTAVDYKFPRVKKMHSEGVLFDEYYIKFKTKTVKRSMNKFLPARYHFQTGNRIQDEWVKQIRARQCDLGVVSQGGNYDGLYFAEICQRAGLPYVIVVQKASDHDWPSDYHRATMRDAYHKALRVYFVSEHNMKLTERQIGQALPNAEVVRNPFLISVREPLPYPATLDGVFRLACVARMYIFDKGQDILLNVLSSDKWKQRPLEVSFYGKGMNSASMLDMANFLGVKNAKFCGFTNSVTDVWKDHHALILSSRAEGLPLAQVEAMICGRPVIVTDVGGCAEVIEDGTTGFVADSASVAALDEALERAWEQRENWREIGLKASERILQQVPPDPCKEFADEIERVVCHLKKRR